MGANDTAEPFGIGAIQCPGLAKVVEEAGECVQVIAKLIATGGDAEHWSGIYLDDALIEELGDLLAAIQYVCWANRGMLPGVTDRSEVKLRLFKQWHEKSRRVAV